MRISLASPPSVRAKVRASARRAGFAKSYRPVDRKFVAERCWSLGQGKRDCECRRRHNGGCHHNGEQASLMLASATSAVGVPQPVCGGGSGPLLLERFPPYSFRSDQSVGQLRAQQVPRPSLNLSTWASRRGVFAPPLQGFSSTPASTV